MAGYKPRNVSVNALCVVADAICKHLEISHTTRCLNVSLALDTGLSIVTVKAAVVQLLALRAFDVRYTWRRGKGVCRWMSYPTWEWFIPGWYCHRGEIYKAMSMVQAVKLGRAAVETKDWKQKRKIRRAEWRMISRVRRYRELSIDPFV